MLDYCVQYLMDNSCSCVAYNGQTLLKSKKRGVAPLLGWLEEGISLEGYAAADKVVGKGAAFLYLLLKLSKLHAFVISEPALEILRQQGVTVTYDQCVPAIRNRDNTGFCPIESAVLTCDEPYTALMQIKDRLKQLSK